MTARGGSVTPTTAGLPRFPLLRGPTPLHEMPRLRAALGGDSRCPRLLIKRDDLAGPALGGNKARKLELVVGDALAQEATHLVTVGGTQSNHARMTAAAARLAGLHCTLVLTSTSTRPPREGNLLLDHLLGATVRFVAPGPDPIGENPHATGAVAEILASIEAQGGRPCYIPLGASTALGTLGYLDAAREMDAQLETLEARADRVYFAAGSRGTQAGLVLAARLDRTSWTPYGVAVSPGDPAKTEAAVELVRGAAERIGARVDVAPEQLLTRQDCYGGGYAVPTPEGTEAIQLLARTEAIFLDPTYTGKAMAGLIDDVRQGRAAPDQTLVFLHTGGVPALFCGEPAPATA